MHILTTSTLSQEIKIKPRRTSTLGDVIVELTNKGERKTYSYTVSKNFSSVSNIMTLTHAFTNLISDVYYTLVVKDDVSEIYRGMLYVTNQENYDKYEVGKGDYTIQSSFDNEFVFLDSEDAGSPVTLCYDEAEMASKTSSFQVCDLYCVTIDGVTYDDWYVPAKGEVEAFLADFPKITNNQLEQYGYDRIPEGIVTPPLDIDYRYIWTSTELSQSHSYMWQIPLYGSNIVNSQKDLPESLAYLPLVVRPFRFEPSTDESIITGDKFAGGVVACNYTRDGVEGKLIISPTQPQALTHHVFWSDLGQTVTGATSETNGETNSNIVLALENA